MKKTFITAIGFIIIGIGSYGIYKLVTLFVHSLNQIEASLAAAIVGAMATVIGAVSAVVISQQQARKRSIEESHRGKKIEVYKGFLEIAARNLGGSNKNVSIKAPTEKELIKFMLDFKTELILWGSPKVIKAYLAFEHASKTHGTHILLLVNSLYLAIREDVGLSNKALNNNELIKMYLNDPSEIDEIDHPKSS